MFEIFKKSLFAGLGLAVVTKTKLESVLEKLVEEGKLSRDEAEKMGKELLDSGEKQAELSTSGTNGFGIN